ncbi:hypothetical protein OAO87_01115 [bacterium]|nr:hypothetical protein [bacterium]
MQDRVMSFYNSLLHWLSRPEVADRLVPSLREMLSQALTQLSQAPAPNEPTLTSSRATVRTSTIRVPSTHWLAWHE